MHGVKVETEPRDLGHRDPRMDGSAPPPLKFKSGTAEPSSNLKVGPQDSLQNLKAGPQDSLRSLKVGLPHLSLMNSFFIEYLIVFFFHVSIFVSF